MSEGVLIEGCAVAAVDAAGTEHAEGWILTDGPRIAGLGGGAPPPVPDGTRRIDGRGLLATPGLVNCHHHLYQWSTRGMAQDQDLFGWLTALYPRWALIDEEIVHRSARAGLAALAVSGCSTTTDHHYLFPRAGGDLLGATIRAAEELGLRFHPGRGSMDLGASAGGLPPDEVVEDRDTVLVETEAAIDRWHDPAPESMLRIAVAPCSPFSVTRELMTEAAGLARRRGVRLHTHLAETAEEEAFCVERFGVRPVEYLDDLDWLGPDVWLAHCVHLSPEEVGRLAATGTSVAHCPSSNARLGAGIAPAADLAAAGVAVGLGVDGAASNESGELAVELRQALLVARLRGGAAAMTARDGARARHHPRRPLPGARGRDRLAGAGEARRHRPLAHRRRGPRRAGRPGGGPRAGPAAPGRGAAGERAAGGGGRAPADRRPRRDRPRGRGDGAVPAREHHPDPPARAHRRERPARRRRAQGARRVRLLLRPPRRRDAVGGHAAQPAPQRRDPRHRPHPSRDRARRAGGAAPLGRARPPRLRDGDRRPAGAGLRPRALPGGARGDRGRRPPRDGAARGGAGGGRLRAHAGAHERRGRPRAGRPPAAPRRQPAAAGEGAPRRSRRRGRGRGAGRVRGRDAGPGLPGAGVGPRRAGRGRRDRPLHRHPVAARGPGPGRRQPRPAARADAAAPGRRRRGLRRAARTSRCRCTWRCSPCTPAAR